MNGETDRWFNMIARSRGTMRTQSVGATSVSVAGYSDSRIGIGFGVPTSGTFTVGTINPVTAEGGIIIPTNGQWQWLFYFQHGDLVRREWFAVHSAATRVLAVFELFAAYGIGQ